MSSISPIETKEFAKRINKLGCDYLDAPVSGGEVGAKNAALTIMVGGSRGRVRQGQAAVRADGQEHHAGRRQRRRPDLQGCNQIIVALNIEAVGEALLFASKAGADPAKVRQALMGGFAASRILEVHGERMIKRTFDPGLPHRAAPEGSEPRAARARARWACPCPTPPPRRSCSTPAVASGGAKWDHSAMVRALEMMANHEVAKA